MSQETPYQLLGEEKIREIATRFYEVMDELPEAAMDTLRPWAQHGESQDLQTAIDILTTEYLTPRRIHLFEHARRDLGILPHEILHVAQSLTHDMVPATVMGMTRRGTRTRCKYKKLETSSSEMKIVVKKKEAKNRLALLLRIRFRRYIYIYIYSTIILKNFSFETSCNICMYVCCCVVCCVDCLFGNFFFFFFRTVPCTVFYFFGFAT